jgi:hypothetical protein
MPNCWLSLPSGLFAGRFLAELTKQVFADLAASKYQVIALFLAYHSILGPFCA